MAKSELIDLLKHRSVSFGEFQLASGQTSTFYIDARRTTMSAEGLHLVGTLGLAAIREAGWAPSCVGGLTLGADPVAYAIAMASRGAPPHVDAFTVRKAAKEHGTGRRIEGCSVETRSVVVVEDVITTGSSALEAARAVSDAGGHVLGVLAVVDREEDGRHRVEAEGFGVQALVTVSDLGISR